MSVMIYVFDSENFEKGPACCIQVAADWFDAASLMAFLMRR